MNLYPEDIPSIDSYYKALDSFYVYAGDKEDKVNSKIFKG